MLVTDPKNRAPLSEIMNHPWMTKGTNGPPDNYLPPREPLQLPLDEQIIEKMTGFEFGPPEWIRNQLENIINSDDYQRAIRQYNKRHQTHSTDSANKRTSVFDFYQRRRSNLSKDGLANPSTETIPSGEDPVNAFHPLLSIYYLVREKQDREKQESNPGASSIPLGPGEKPLAIPDLPGPPQAAYTNSHATERPGEAPTGGRARPRARTQGEDEIQADKPHTAPKPAEPSSQPTPPTINEPPSRSPAPERKSTTASILRRFSTRRNRDHEQRDSSKGTSPPALAPVSLGEDKEKEKASRPIPISTTGTTSQAPRHSFSIRKTRERDTPPSSYKPPISEPQQTTAPLPTPDYLAPPSSAREPSSNSENEPSTPNRLRKGLGRSASVNSSDVRRKWSTRRGANEGGALKGKSGADSEKNSLSDQKRTGSTSPWELDKDNEAKPKRTFSARTKSLGHGRRSGVQPDRNERRERDHAATPKEGDLLEETDAELAAEEAEEGGYSSAEPGTSRGRTVEKYASRGAESQEALKPVYLKGLFSVSTTSSKPLNFIRSDIIRVLRQLGVSYKEIKGGFTCRLAPSIDVSIKDSKDGDNEKTPVGTPQQTHRRKISFAGLRNNEKQREDSKHSQDDEKLFSPDPEKTPLTPRTTRSSNQNTTYTSYNNSEAEDSEHDVAVVEDSGVRKSATLRKRNSRLSGSSARPGEPKERMAGETSTHVQSDMGNKNLALKFEILVVKVPILSLHGLQFKKVEGGTWQYKRMADRILGELRL